MEDIHVVYQLPTGIRWFVLRVCVVPPLVTVFQLTLYTWCANRLKTIAPYDIILTSYTLSRYLKARYINALWHQLDKVAETKEELPQEFVCNYV